MLTSVSIKNFRCLNRLTIEPLDRVNLIAGMNNVGKTALLEAIFLLSGTENVSLVIRINAFRGIERVKLDTESVINNVWRPLFSNYNMSNPVILKGELQGKGQFSVELSLTLEEASARVDINGDELDLGTNGLSNQAMLLRYTNPSGEPRSLRLTIPSNAAGEIQIAPSPGKPLFPGFFLAARKRLGLTEIAERFGQLQQEKRETDYLVNALRSIEPRLERLISVFSGGVPVIHGDIGLDHLIPLPLMGEGLRQLVSILLTISDAPGGIVLIDEIENGFHYSILPSVWQVIRQAAQDFDTQIFATTHSLECAKAAHEVFESSDDYEFRYHRLERIDGEIRVATSDQETMGTALGLNWEIR